MLSKGFLWARSPFLSLLRYPSWPGQGRGVQGPLSRFGEPGTAREPTPLPTETWLPTDPSSLHLPQHTNTRHAHTPQARLPTTDPSWFYCGYVKESGILHPFVKMYRLSVTGNSDFAKNLDFIFLMTL